MLETLRVHGEAPEAEILERTVAVLCRGDLVIYPTDTLYALGGRAQEAAVPYKVRAAKGRDEGKPLPLVAADIEQVVGLCSGWPTAARRLAERFWPGPLTLVLPAVRDLPEGITAGSGTVAVRVPGLALVRALCARVGPLISTSANFSGAPPAATCAEAVAGVGRAASLALDAGPGAALVSTIVDCTRDSPGLLRRGLVSWEELEAFLRAGGC